MGHRQSSKNAARDLLQSIISEEQWNRFSKTGMLELEGKAGVYHLSAEAPTQVLDSETRRVVAITHLPTRVPVAPRDRVIAEYLFIRNDENLYWQTATLSTESPSS